MSTPTAIRLTDLSRDYGGKAAVDGIDLTVPQGAFLVLLGPSGCGKTTTLRMLAGLETPTGGQIELSGSVVATGASGDLTPPSRRGAGLVFQSYALWPHMSVRGNIEWPLKIAKWPKATRSARADEVMEMLAIRQLADRYPGEISGGQQQRVAIARMIGPEPKVLLFDEPLSNLDAKLRVETRSELLRIHRLTGATSVYVTHDQVEAMTMATHIALMRDGRIEQFGSPAELAEEPRTAFVATFIGTPPANLLPGQVQEGRVQVAGVDVGRCALPDATPVQVMYRAETLRIDPGGPLRMEVFETSPLAGRWIVTGSVDGRRVSLACDDNPIGVVGSTIGVGLPAHPGAVFDATGIRVDPDGVIVTTAPATAP
ncbi:MAG: ABC transporter ATP-binding protein [Actinobacteria bacterium]|nr:ABC transporter ATP-binding protein [Actinomycetota bacterium]